MKLLLLLLLSLLLLLLRQLLLLLPPFWSRTSTALNGVGPAAAQAEPWPRTGLVIGDMALPFPGNK